MGWLLLPPGMGVLCPGGRDSVLSAEDGSPPVLLVFSLWGQAEKSLFVLLCVCSASWRKRMIFYPGRGLW